MVEQRTLRTPLHSARHGDFLENATARTIASPYPLEGYLAILERMAATT
jgi:hypothetical protein